MPSSSLRMVVLSSLMWVVFASTASALYRGDEFEPRDWKLSDEYFLDLLSFQPRYEYRLKLRKQDRAYLGAGGSINSNDLFVFQELKARSDTIQLDPRTNGDHPLKASARFIMDQDFDGTYQHFFLGADIRLSRHWDLQVIGEPVPLKEFADIGFGLKREDETSLYSLQLHLPNFVFDSKNKDKAQFRQQPFNLMWNLQTRRIKGVEFWFRGDIDFPSKTEYPGEAFLFDFEKYRTRFGIDYHLDPFRMLRLEASSELTEKVRQGEVPSDPASFDIDREYWTAMMEYIVYPEDGIRYSAGYKFIRFYETNDFFNDPEESFNVDRYDHLVFTTASKPLNRDFHIGTGLYLEWLDLNRDVVLQERPNRKIDTDGLRAKWSGEIIFHHDTYHVALGPSLDLDTMKFGGGYLNVYFDF